MPDPVLANMNEILGEPDLCGCEHSLSQDHQVLGDLNGPWGGLTHRCTRCCCTMDGGGYVTHGPFSDHGEFSRSKPVALPDWPRKTGHVLPYPIVMLVDPTGQVWSFTDPDYIRPAPEPCPGPYVPDWESGPDVMHHTP
jgi:hypothetical protein